MPPFLEKEIPAMLLIKLKYLYSQANANYYSNKDIKDICQS